MNQQPSRTRNIGSICAVCTAVCLLLFWVPPRWTSVSERLALAELGFKDLLNRRSARYQPDPRLIFVGIDQTSYADVISPEEAAASPALATLTNSFPWSRDLWAAAIERLAGAGAKAVVLDLIFAAPGSGDDKLRAALDRYADQVVVGVNFTGGKRAGGEGLSVVYPSDTVLPVKNEAAPWNDPRLGFVNFFSGENVGPREVDDIVRRAVFRVSGDRGLPPHGTLESLASRAVKKLGAGHLVPDDTAPHLFRFVAPPGDGFRPIPLYTIFLPSHWSNNFDGGKFFEGKVVVIGPAANILHDEHRTPFNATMLGPEIHLNAMSAVLRGEFIGECSAGWSYGLIAGFGGLAWLLAMIIRSPVRRLVVAALVVAGYVAACFAAVHYLDFALLAVTPLLAFTSSSLTNFAYDFVLLRLEKNRTRRTLERYVSKDVVRDILDNPGTYLNTLGGVRKPVTILFSDIRGFTTLTEGADASLLVKQLNEYFDDMVRIVFAQHGRLDKFIGDAVMADWGSIVTGGAQEDARRAVATALEMRKYLARLNVNWKQRGITELSFGIGINHGEVIVGNLGSEQKMEVSVIGDAVNLASRLEGLTKEYKLDLLLGETMVPLVQDRFVLRSVDSVQVKGKKQPVRVFTVVVDKETGEEPPAWLERYEHGLGLYRTRRFPEALAAFEDCARTVPEDYLIELYLKRCRELVANPPGAEWDTVFVMKSK